MPCAFGPVHAIRRTAHQHDKAACRHACHGQHRAADNHTEHGACGQPFTDAAQQHQQQSIAHRDAQALGDSLTHRLLHAAKAVGQQRLHGEQGQVDAKAQQAGAEQHIQDGIHRQIHHRRAEAVHQCTGQQLFLQLFRGRVLAVQGAQGGSADRPARGRAPAAAPPPPPASPHSGRWWQAPPAGQGPCPA